MAPSDVDALQNTRGIDIFVGKDYPDVDALKNALSDAAIRTGREYKSVKKTKSKLTMKCKGVNCDWRIHASRVSKLPTFKVVKYQKVHTCLGRQGGDHAQATIRWITSKIWRSIENNRDMEPKNIVKEIKDSFGIDISYNKAAKAKRMALKGLCEASLPRFIEELKECGNVAKGGFDVDGGFQYLFWAFCPFIQALRENLRPVLYVKATAIEIGVVLRAYSFDGNGWYVYNCDVIDVAFGIFLREDDMAWETFCLCLKEFLLTDTFISSCSDPFTIVIDMNEAATRAVRKCFPDVHYFFFQFSLRDVFLEKFKDENLRGLFIKTCDSLSRRPGCEKGLEEMKRINGDAYDWLLSLGPSHWARAFYANGAHICPWALDGTLYEIQEKSNGGTVVDFVKCSIDFVGSYFSERQIVGNKITTKFVTRVEDGICRIKEQLSQHVFHVESIALNNYRVVHSSFWFIEPRVVDLVKRSCSCGDFQSEEYPCDHAIAVILHVNLDLTEYIPRWYTAETYRAIYSGKIPTLKREKGRPKKKLVHTE